MIDISIRAGNLENGLKLMTELEKKEDSSKNELNEKRRCELYL
jgi:hypothetical protein